MEELGHAMRNVYFPLERADMCISGLTHLGVRVKVLGTRGVFASKSTGGTQSGVWMLVRRIKYELIIKLIIEAMINS
jgi:hypothetical protein